MHSRMHGQFYHWRVPLGKSDYTSASRGTAEGYITNSTARYCSKIAPVRIQCLSNVAYSLPLGTATYCTEKLFQLHFCDAMITAFSNISVKKFSF